MSVDEISLRRCTFHDAAELSLVGSATFLEAFAERLESSSILAHCQKHHSIAEYEKYLQLPDTQAWLAVVPGAGPVGYAILTEPDLPLPGLAPTDIELKRIYVFSRFRATGAGKHLLDQSIDAAREANKNRLLLGVYTENHRALAFYRKHGFEQVGTRTFQIGNNLHDDLILGRPI